MDTQCMLDDFPVVPHLKSCEQTRGHRPLRVQPLLRLSRGLETQHGVLLTYHMIAFDWIILNLVATLHTYVTLLRDPIYRL
jgi:hypothetical protein